MRADITFDTLPFDQLCELFNYSPKKRPLNTDEVAEFLGVRRNTLEQHRLNGTGPRYFQPQGTRKVWYLERDMLLWLLSGARTSTSQQPGEPLPI
ncbi:helix-turn-helix transcriptional regulator [Enterobacterales bacterium BD_CKDN230030183-1A_HGKHYDSX7]